MVERVKKGLLSMNNVLAFPEKNKEIPKHIKDPVSYIINSCCLTPDFIALKNSPEQFHLVFVWDDLQKDHIYHGYVEDGAYFGKAETNGRNFCMRMDDKGNTPLVFECSMYRLGDRVIPTIYTGKIAGEVYAVPLRALADIDLIMSNTQACEREETWISLSDQNGISVKAWMYLNKFEFFDKGNNEVLHLKEGPSRGYGQYNKVYHYHEPSVYSSSSYSKEDAIRENYKINEYMGLDEPIYL